MPLPPYKSVFCLSNLHTRDGCLRFNLHTCDGCLRFAASSQCANLAHHLLWGRGRKGGPEAGWKQVDCEVKQTREAWSTCRRKQVLPVSRFPDLELRCR